MRKHACDKVHLCREIEASRPPGEDPLQRSAAVRFAISKDERAPHAARVSASQAILDRAYGKAPTLNTSDPTVMKRAIDMSDDELAAIASGAKLTLVKSDT